MSHPEPNFDIRGKMEQKIDILFMISIASSGITKTGGSRALEITSRCLDGPALAVKLAV